jgi:hypothetical protein
MVEGECGGLAWKWWRRHERRFVRPECTAGEQTEPDRVNGLHHPGRSADPGFKGACGQAAASVMFVLLGRALGGFTQLNDILPIIIPAGEAGSHCGVAAQD